MGTYRTTFRLQWNERNSVLNHCWHWTWLSQTEAASEFVHRELRMFSIGQQINGHPLGKKWNSFSPYTAVFLLFTVIMLFVLKISNNTSINYLVYMKSSFLSQIWQRAKDITKFTPYSYQYIPTITLLWSASTVVEFLGAIQILIFSQCFNYMSKL
jgi:hypothetical protein